jgi:hypothetical protein
MSKDLKAILTENKEKREALSRMSQTPEEEWMTINS